MTGAQRAEDPAKGRSRGSVVVVGTPIGNLGDLSPRSAAALRDADVIACEDTRRTRGLLSHAGITGKPLVALHRHNEASVSLRLAKQAEEGETVAVVSDAGMPIVSDPGARLVREAIALSVPVTVVPGPSAVTSALALSGLDSTRFCFEGFLPARGKERSIRVEQLAACRRTTVFFEAPHRLARTLVDLVSACGPTRKVALARELTKLHEEVWRGTLAEAAQLAQQGNPLGEHTIVLEGAEEPTAPDERAISETIGALVEAGDSSRDAADKAALILGVSRRVAYEAALKVKQQGNFSHKGHPDSP